MFIVLPVTWVADSGAYLIGRAFGRTQFSPRLSPKKTWEGFWAGAILGTLAAPGLVSLYQHFGGPVVTFWQALLFGIVLSTLPALGDLGESMFKRQAGVKDSSQIIPGHGGVFDRIDSWLWAAVLGYYLIRWLSLNA
jgi:phosphatidate cytidylyltransferase